MKINIIYYKVVVLFLCTLNVCLLIFANSKNKQNLKSIELIQNNQDTISYLNNYNENIFLTFSLMFDVQSEAIDGNILLIDTNNKNIRLSQLAQGSPKLILKYSSLNCGVCVDELIMLLKNVSEKFGSNNIIIITDYNTPRELMQFIKLNQINFKILNMQNNNFTPLDKSLPYFFILDESLTLKLLFVPIKGQINLTKQYLEKTGKRFLI